MSFAYRAMDPPKTAEKDASNTPSSYAVKRGIPFAQTERDRLEAIDNISEGHDASSSEPSLARKRSVM